VQTLQQAPEETLDWFPVAAFLNQDVEHHAILIHGAPKILLHVTEALNRVGVSSSTTAGGRMVAIRDAQGTDYVQQCVAPSRYGVPEWDVFPVFVSILCR
jgi:hypothetical protein